MNALRFLFYALSNLVRASSAGDSDTFEALSLIQRSVAHVEKKEVETGELMRSHAKDLSFIHFSRELEVPSECSNFPSSTGACAWTEKYSCAGQTPGSLGNATDDGNLGYRCCCGYGMWRTSESSASPGDAYLRTGGVDGERQVVWVSGYPRSSTSTVLSMVSAASGHEDAREPGSTFSLFEPCHDGDEVSDILNATGCMGLLSSISKCEFSGVGHLWGWPDPHSTNNRTPFSNATATSNCLGADVIAFKTVDFAHDLSRYLGMLDNDPHLKILDVVRDPRGIWASWKTTDPFKDLIVSGDFYTLAEICENFASNLQLKHPRIHHLVFEELVASPLNTTRGVYHYLGIPFGAPQQRWVNSTFNAKDCPPPPPGIPIEFMDCHQDSDSHVEKWRTVLSEDELNAFNADANCQLVVQHYGFAKS